MAILGIVYSRQLADLAMTIIVLSATGLSGHPDLSVGSVAEYLINHVDKPILLVRGRGWTPPRAHRCGEEAEVVRLPSRALI